MFLKDDFQPQQLCLNQMVAQPAVATADARQQSP